MFTVPDDLFPSGYYKFEVLIPNTSGESGSGLGEILSSDSHYFEMMLPDSASFSINCEKLICDKETSPGWLGSDEIGLTMIST